MAMMMQTKYFSDLNDIVGDNIVGQYCRNIVGDNFFTLTIIVFPLQEILVITSIE